jgi:hypothetical protein
MLPPEIFALEIGVGSGVRAALWLDRFRALDEARDTSYYPRLRFLGDYSLPTLDRAMAAVAAHREVVSVLAMDALNPFRTLAFLRYKVLSIHLTNVYDNLPHDELVRRSGRLYVDAHLSLHVCYGNRYGKPSWEGSYRYLSHCTPTITYRSTPAMAWRWAAGGAPSAPTLSRISLACAVVKCSGSHTCECQSTRPRAGTGQAPVARRTPSCGITPVANSSMLPRIWPWLMYGSAMSSST